MGSGRLVGVREGGGGLNPYKYVKDVYVGGNNTETNATLAAVRAYALQHPALDEVRNPYNTFETDLARIAGGYPEEAANDYNPVESIMTKIASNVDRAGK